MKEQKEVRQDEKDGTLEEGILGRKKGIGKKEGRGKAAGREREEKGRVGLDRESSQSVSPCRPSQCCVNVLAATCSCLLLYFPSNRIY